MKIGGLQKFTLSDFPGRVAAMVFTQGCNFRCPFCHNGQLIDNNDDEQAPLFPQEDVLAFLQARRQHLDGVVVSGGEPTLQPDLVDFIRSLKAMGYAVKLDTNGSRPEVLRELYAEGLVDYVAMDVKAPLAGYERLAGKKVNVERIAQSINLIANSGVAHEFRTTVVDMLLSEGDLASIQAIIPPGSPYKLQEFQAEHALDPVLASYVPVEAEDMVSELSLSGTSAERSFLSTIDVSNIGQEPRELD